MPYGVPQEERSLMVESPSRGTDEPRIGRSISLDDAATLLGVSRRTIYNRIREGRLQTVRTLGGSQRVVLGSMQDAARPSPLRGPAPHSIDRTTGSNH
jgi:excisionase family DNA binding protein